MDITNLNIGIVKKANLKQNKSSRCNIGFKGDVTEFSPVAKEKAAIIQQLQSYGFDLETANKLVSENYGTDKYFELVNGSADDCDIVHCINIDRNLTPTEAVLYQGFDMDDYYMQYFDCYPSSYASGEIDSEKYEIGEANFVPTDLVKYLLKGYDIALSAMIAKGKIDEKTADKISKYYTKAYGCFEDKCNVKQAEYTIDKLTECVDKLDEYTNKDKAQEMGLSRALSVEEAVALFDSDNLDKDNNQLNNYIQFNSRFGYSVFDMDFIELWDKTVEQFEQERAQKSKVTSLRVKQHFENLQEKIEHMKQNDIQSNSIYYDDIKGLNSDKFFNRLTHRAIKPYPTWFAGYDSELVHKNVGVLNSMSDELLDKISYTSTGNKKTMPSINPFLRVADLDERVRAIEEYRVSSPELFDNMEREFLLDYLTNSDLYSRAALLHEYFTGRYDFEELSSILDGAANAPIIPLTEKSDE